MQFLEKGCKGMVRKRRSQKITKIKNIACFVFLDCLSQDDFRRGTSLQPLFSGRGWKKLSLFLYVCWFSLSLSLKKFLLFSLSKVQANVATPQTLCYIFPVFLCFQFIFSCYSSLACHVLFIIFGLI